MKVRAVDSENDWTFGKGKNSYKSDLDALAQNIKCRLQCFIGDCFFNLSGGIDWFGLIGSKEIDRLRLEVSACILNTEGVTKITFFEIITDEDRGVLFKYSVDTVHGELPDQEYGVPNV